MISSCIVSIWMLLLPFVVESCTVRIESINCTHKEITNVHFTCHSNVNQEACSCIFEDPLKNDFGWYKMCAMKNDSKTGKKKVRKRQIQVPDNCASIQPPRPGKVSCIWSPREIVCTGTCYNGFRFIDGRKEQTYSCRSSEGYWKPTGSFPACQPQCNPPCQNGGRCTAPNFCSCTNQYRGEVCQYGLAVCAFSKNSLPSSWHCNHNNKGTFCDISCHAPGTPESYVDVQHYVCSVDGLWTPQLPPCVQVISLCEDPGNIENGRRFTRSQTFLLGSTVSYECNDGYTMTGNSLLTCQSNRQWSSEKPSCILKPVPIVIALDRCPKPNAPKNAVLNVIFPDTNPLQNIFNSELPLLQRLYITLSDNSSERQKSDLQSLSDGLFTVGTRVQYKCKSRFYKLYGSEYQTCLPTLTWSGYQPACVPECGKSDSPKTPFVVNGDSTQIGQWPWMIAIALKGNKGLQLLCGGVLITDTWVLTAAHCVTKKLSNIPMDPKHFSIYAGKYYRKFTQDDEYVQIKAVKQIVVHEEYDFTQFDSDIALIQLESAVELTSRVQPICLPTEITTRENIRDEQKGIVLGWGLTENATFSETLRETVLPVVNHEKCEEAYREGLRTVTITQNMFCAGYDSGASDTCNGDSGGPFMFSVGPPHDRRWYLEGIVSWGSETGCAKANRYSGFTKIGRFVPWINMFI
ncbi:limulus clotting factor C-like isoform X2 [Argiope bruennichi]|uniref:limulus clotting factor C-like isoform X2 n=1 Tax=Argiope bruennichi TaxID=94029 RepID=UPI002494AE7D|nr:limulus clotting factor C-like isoform X2 [Argiope bruennichi]